jgi:tripartite-type tricarboxylate transporter receptor subunit TctC
MTTPRRRFLRLAAGTVALPVISRVATAQAYPTHPITMIVPIAAGSPADVLGRLVAERMGTALGQLIIIENVPGADGSIGVGRVARARPDGYTIEFGFQGANALNGAFYSLSYDLFGDLTPISPAYSSGGTTDPDLYDALLATVEARLALPEVVTLRASGRQPRGSSVPTTRQIRG